MNKHDLKWVSCTPEVNRNMSRHKHATEAAAEDKWVRTLCGASGSWEAFNSKVGKKQRCPECVAAQLVTSRAD